MYEQLRAKHDERIDRDGISALLKPDANELEEQLIQLEELLPEGYRYVGE